MKTHLMTMRIVITAIVVCTFFSGATHAATFHGLGLLPGNEYSFANAVSADGSTAVGSSSGVYGEEAFIWNAADGISGLGYLPGGTNFSPPQSIANGVSADGSIVAGWSKAQGSGIAVFRWEAGSGNMVSLGYQGLRIKKRRLVVPERS